MYATPSHVAEQMARAYTRDRIRDAEARRAGRAAQMAARERRYAEPAAVVEARVRRWWTFSTRRATA